MHICISLSSKFHLKHTILIFWTKFDQKGYFQLKTEKVNTTIEFCIFKLVWVPSFSWNWQFWFLDQICPKRAFAVGNRKKKWISPLNCAYFNQSYFNLNRRFWFFFGPNLPKKDISGRKQEKWTPPLNSAYLH